MLSRLRSFLLACLAVLGAAGAARAQYYVPDNPSATYLIGGLGFEQLAYEGVTYDADFDPLGSVGNLYSDTTAAGDRYSTVLGGGTYSSRVALFWNGANLSSNWAKENNLTSPGDVGGIVSASTVGGDITTTRRLDPADVLAAKNMESEAGAPDDAFFPQRAVEFIVKNVNPGMTAALRINAAGYTVSALKFAAWHLGGSATLTWYYSVDGTALIAAPSASPTGALGTAATAYTVDLSAVSALAGKSTIWLVVRFSGTEGTRVILDNIQVIGTAPATPVAPTLSGSPPAGQVGVAYSYAFTVTGTPAPTVAVTSGSLPPGLSLANGTLAGTPTTAGSYAFTLTADNDVGSPATVSRTIVVAAAAGAPKITSAATATFVRGVAGTFTVTASGNPDPVFALTGAPGWLTLQSTTGVLGGTPPVNAPASVDFTIVASNGLSPDATQAFTLAIHASPVFGAASYAATFVAGQAGTVTVSASGTPAPTYSLASGAPAWLSINAATGVISGTPPSTTGSPLTVTVLATNAVARVSIPLVLTIQPALQSPVITSPGTAIFRTGVPGSFTSTASGNPVPSFSLINAPLWLSINPVTGVVSGTPPAGTPAVVTFSVQAANGVAPAAIQTFVLTVNSPPTITSAGAATFIVGQAASFAVTAVAQPAPVFSLAGAPGWLSIDPGTGLITGIPPADAPAGLAFTIRAANGLEPDATQTFTLEILAPPLFTSAASADFTVGHAGAFTVKATGRPAPVFSLAGAPAWLAIDAAGGMITGTPPADALGAVAFTIRADNGLSPVAAQSFVLNVVSPPTITSAATTVFSAETEGTFTVRATGTPAATFGLDGAPAWLSIDPVSGVLKGTPPISDGPYVFSFTITAGNGVSPDAAQAFTLVVHQKPRLTSATSTSFTPGVAGSFTVLASGNPAPAFSLGEEAPAWLSVDPVSGVLSGTPADTAGSPFVFPIVATSVAGESTQSFTLTVSLAPRSPVITSAGTATFVAGVAGVFDVTASAHPAPVFTLTGAPAWLAIDAASGRLAGTPPFDAPETVSFVVRAANGLDPDATQEFALTILLPPAITSAASATFVRGEAGTCTIAASGRPAPQFSLSGAPAWLGINPTTGVLGGTPPQDAPDMVAFTIEAANGVSPSAIQNFQLYVNAGLAITSPSGATFVAGDAGVFTVVASGSPAPVFSLRHAPDWLSIDPASGVLSGTPPADSLSSFAFEIVAANGVSADFTQAFILTVQVRPEFVSDASTTFQAGQAGTFQVQATGRPAPVYSLAGAPAWLALDPLTGVLSGTPPAETPAAVSFTLAATNDAGAAGQTFTLLIDAAGAAPAFLSAATATFVTGRLGTFTVQATGSPAPAFLLSGAPAWLALDPLTGVLSGTPPIDAGVSISFTVSAVNGVAPDATQVFTLTLVAPPVFTSGNSAAFVSGRAGSFAVLATGRPAPRFSLSGAPAWLKLDPTTGMLTGTPPAGAPTTLAFTLRADNGVEPAATQKFQLAVWSAPRITSAAKATFVAGKRNTFTVAAQGYPAPVRLLSGAPAWLALDPVTGVLSGTPPAAAPSSLKFTVRATNGVVSDAEQTLTLTVITRPAVTTQPKSQVVAVGGSVGFSVASSAKGTVTYQWLRDGVAIAGATKTSYRIAKVRTADASAAFTCRISNQAGQTVSNAARLLVIGEASRRLGLAGGKSTLTLYVPAGLTNWTASTTSAWLGVRRSSSTKIELTASALKSGTRSSKVKVALLNGSAATRTVTQSEAVLAAGDFPTVFSSSNTTTPWAAKGSRTPTVLGTFKGHTSVVALYPESTATTARAAAATSTSNIAVYGRNALSTTTSLRLESDVLLKIGQPSIGATEASIGLVAKGKSVGSVSGDGVQFSLLQEASSTANPLAGGVWLKAWYRDEKNRLVTLDRALGVPLSESAAQKWIRLRVEISTNRKIVFWMDPEPFGDPVRVWAPAPKVPASFLGGGRVVARLQSATTGNRPYLSRLRATADYAPADSASRLTVLSARVFVDAGEGKDKVIASLTTADAPVSLLVRGLGPALATLGVDKTLAAPRLVAYDASTPAFILRVQDAWTRQRDSASVAAIRTAATRTGALALSTDSADSAWLYTPSPATPLKTIHLKSAKTGGTGEALLELYEMPDTQTGRLVGLSTRAFVPAGRAAIPGFVIKGNMAKLYLVRVVGPGLKTLGVTAPIEQTSLALYRGQTAIRRNAGWGTSDRTTQIARAAASAGVAALTAGSGDSAILVRLTPGTYTATATSAVASRSGVAQVEVYEVSDDSVDTLVNP